MTAEKEQDWPEFVACLTPEGVDVLAGRVLHASVELRDNPLSWAKELHDDIDEVFERHGVTQQMQQAAFDASSDTDVAGLAAGIKDKPSFVADMLPVISWEPLNNPVLKDVIVDGDSATGWMLVETTQHPFTFRKIDGEWKLNHEAPPLPAKPAKFGSAEASHSTFLSAWRRKYWPAVVECFTPEMQDIQAGLMVYNGTVIIDSPLEWADPWRKGIEETFQRDGITLQMQQEAKDLRFTTFADFARLAAAVEDKPKFLADMMAVSPAWSQPPEHAELKDLKIDGDTATGLVNYGQRDLPITFKKIDGKWKQDCDPSDSD